MTKKFEGQPDLNEKFSGKTEAGFPFVIEARRLNNYLLLRYISKADKGDIEAVDKVLDLLLGKAQAEKFIDFLIEEDGILPNDKIFTEIKSIFEQVEKLKK